MIAVVSCGARKATTPQPAKDLYTGAYFKKARAAAEGLGCPWLIMSALHGLVKPDTVLDPYEQNIHGMNIAVLRGTVHRQVQAGMLGRGSVIVDFTPEAYHRVIADALGKRETGRIVRPLQHLGQGQAMHVMGLIAERGEIVMGRTIYERQRRAD